MYTESGIMPIAQVREYYSARWYWSLHWIHHGTAWQATMFVLAAILAACAGSPESTHPRFAPQYGIPVPPAKPMDGRIYQQGREFSLFQDVKARQVGDILTVVLTESTSGQKSADTSIDKSTSNNISVPEVAGETWGNLGATLDSERRSISTRPLATII